MVKINKIILASLVSAFGFALFNNSNSFKDTSTALAATSSTNNSDTNQSKFKTLHSKIIPASLRITLKKSDGSYYDANRLYIRFDDTKRGYHGSIGEIKKIQAKPIKGGTLYFVVNDNDTDFGVANTKNKLTLLYPVGKKWNSIEFNK